MTRNELESLKQSDLVVAPSGKVYRTRQPLVVNGYSVGVVLIRNGKDFGTHRSISDDNMGDWAVAK